MGNGDAIKLKKVKLLSKRSSDEVNENLPTNISGGLKTAKSAATWHT